MPEHIISSASRNLGFGSRNHPARSEHGGLYIPAPAMPECRGGLRSIEKAWRDARRLNSGNDWNMALFVNGERIDSYWGIYFDQQAAERLGLDEFDQGAENLYREGWLRPVHSSHWSELVQRLRDGEEIRVRTIEPARKAA